MRGLIYEVALTGVYGTIKEVERIIIYDFFNYLAYKRQNEKAIADSYGKK
jgi:hypothetical protein